MEEIYKNKIMYDTLQILHSLDKSGIKNTNLFITGTVDNRRPEESIKTPEAVALKMLSVLENGDINLRTLEPCAGRGGIVEVLQRNYTKNVVYNEIQPDLKTALHQRFSYDYLNYSDTLDTSFPNNSFDRVVMNPPFDKAVEFLQAMLNYYTKPQAEIVTLFPKYELARLTTHADLYIQLLACKKFSIEDINFSCNYGVNVSLIHIVK